MLDFSLLSQPVLRIYNNSNNNNNNILLLPHVVFSVCTNMMVEYVNFKSNYSLQQEAAYMLL